MDRSPRIFVLSPARTTGKRAALLMNPESQFPLAKQLRTSAGVPLGEVFSFCSSLYFRGKLTYAEHFGRPPKGVEKAYIITSSNGLVPSHLRITPRTMERFAGVPIDANDERYRLPLVESAHELLQRLGASTELVLLGSITTGKYVNPLVECFGEQLLFPCDFIGRGDMSRGGLLLRAAAAGKELIYQQLSSALTRTGKRPPKLGGR